MLGRLVSMRDGHGVEKNHYPERYCKPAKRENTCFMVVDFGAGIYTCRERLKKKGGKVRFF